MTEIHDDFRGDDAALIRSAEAMINLSDRGALVPHGLGGSGRALLAAFIVRMRARMEATTPAPVAWGYVGARELNDLHCKGWAQVLRTPLQMLAIDTPVYIYPPV